MVESSLVWYVYTLVSLRGASRRMERINYDNYAFLYIDELIEEFFAFARFSRIN